MLDRLGDSSLARITLDFDGSVLSTTRQAGGSAVGFNKKKKGAGSYYPLYCTVAQTGQVFDFHHRPGNDHDSNGAETFMLDCFQQIRENLSAKTFIEARMDSAFFSEKVVMRLDDENIEFTQSVPFERFPELKNYVNDNQDWTEYDDEHSFVDLDWKPDNREVHSFSIYRGQKKSEEENQRTITIGFVCAG